MKVELLFPKYASKEAKIEILNIRYNFEKSLDNADEETKKIVNEMIDVIRFLDKEVTNAKKPDAIYQLKYQLFNLVYKGVDNCYIKFNFVTAYCDNFFEGII